MNENNLLDDFNNTINDFNMIDLELCKDLKKILKFIQINIGYDRFISEFTVNDNEYIKLNKVFKMINDFDIENGKGDILFPEFQIVFSLIGDTSNDIKNSILKFIIKVLERNKIRLLFDFMKEEKVQFDDDGVYLVQMLVFDHELARLSDDKKKKFKI